MELRPGRGTLGAIAIENNGGQSGTHLITMARLVVNPGSESEWEIPLGPGTLSLGRSQENDIPLEHESVSSTHCQVIVSDGGTMIKDLGSTNGTFVEGELVEQALLRPGQTVHIGEVQMRFEAEDEPIPDALAAEPASSLRVAAPAQTIAAPVAAAQARCKLHPRTEARFVCPKCHNPFCDFCVNTRAGHKFCRVCGVECSPLKIPRRQPVARAQSFYGSVGPAFIYPLRGDGIILLVVGTLFLCLLNAASFFAAFAGFFGLVAIAFLLVFGIGYVTCYLRRILVSSAMGDDAMPDWPDFSDFSTDILAPFFQLLITLIASFVPALTLALLLASHNAWGGWIIGAAFLAGAIYFPMAFLGVAMFDSVAAVNPLLVVPSILKVPFEYLVTLLLFGAVFVVRWAGNQAMPRVMPSLVAAIIAGFVGLYLLTVQVRILGLLYRSRKSALGWFNR